MKEFLNLCLHRVGPLLGPNRTDTVVFFSSRNGLLTFPLVMREGLLHINMLARLHGPYGGQTVPMVARRDNDRIDGFVIEHFS